MAELAQHLLKARAKAHSWSIESYPGRLKLPGDIFKHLPNAEAANEVRFYLTVARTFRVVYTHRAIWGLDHQDCVSPGTRPYMAR